MLDVSCHSLDIEYEEKLLVDLAFIDSVTVRQIKLLQNIVFLCKYAVSIAIKMALYTWSSETAQIYCIKNYKVFVQSAFFLCKHLPSDCS